MQFFLEITLIYSQKVFGVIGGAAITLVNSGEVSMYPA